MNNLFSFNIQLNYVFSLIVFQFNVLFSCNTFLFINFCINSFFFFLLISH